MDEFIKMSSTLSSTTVLVSPIDYLVDILVRKSVLQRLESLQALDALTDIEGCEYVAVQKTVQSKKVNNFPPEEPTIIHVVDMG